MVVVKGRQILMFGVHVAYVYEYNFIAFFGQSTEISTGFSLNVMQSWPLHGASTVHIIIL